MGNETCQQTLQLALGIQREKGNRSGEAQILSQMAQAYMLFGDHAACIDHLRQVTSLNAAFLFGA